MSLKKKISKTITKNPVVFVFSIIAILYFLPTLLQVEFDQDLHIEKVYIGLPGVLAGDEPHYFVTTTSLINDHDFFVGNNYDNAYFYGGCDVSFHYINNTNPGIERHIQFFDKKKKVIISRDEYRNYEKNGTVEKIYQDYGVEELNEISNRPLGLPLFSSLILWPIAGTCNIEHGAIYITLLISLASIIFFYLISLHYLNKYYPKKKNKKNKDIAKQKQHIQYISLGFTLVFALATQHWHYSKSYFTEPYLAAFLLAAYYLFFIRNTTFIPGFLLALGFSMKYPFGMYLALFGVTLLFHKQWKRIFFFVAGSILPITGVFYYNWILTGNMLEFGRTQALGFGNYAYGIFVWLLDPTFGLLVAAPFLIFSIGGALILWKIDKKTLALLSLMILPYFLFWTSYILTQTGPGGYSARYFIPLLGFFVLLCMIWYAQNKDLLLMWIFYTLVGLSAFINIQAAFAYPLFWHNPPWILLKLLISKFDRFLQVIGL